MEFSSPRRVGLALWPGTPIGDTLEVAKLADQRGLDSIWVTESTLAPGRDAVSILGAMAATTSKIKLATGIINIFTRTPTLIASTVATIDEISNRRAILGLGTGHAYPITNWHSVKFDKPLTRAREYVETIRRILKGERVDYEGRTVKIRGFKLAIAPPRKEVPIYLAAVGPGTARLAGEVGDGVLITMNTVNQLKKLVQIAKNRAADFGRIIDTAALVLSCVAEDHDVGLRTTRRVLALYSSAPFYHKVFVDAGYGEEADEVARLWNSGDREAAAENVSDRMVLDFAAVGLEQVGNMVRKYREAGVKLPIISLIYTEGFDRSITELFRELPA